jgi:hypothetical protein
MTTSFARPALAFACFAAFAIATPAFAETVTFKAQMSAAQEVPPTQSSAKGEVTATYDTASKKLSWKGTYSDLSGPATAAHFHGPAAAGKNAGVAVPIFAGGAAKSPFEGSATLTDAQAQELMSGQWYANIHTANNKAGEIRGQMTK